MSQQVSREYCSTTIFPGAARTTADGPRLEGADLAELVCTFDNQASTKGSLGARSSSEDGGCCGRASKSRSNPHHTTKEQA